MLAISNVARVLEQSRETYKFKDRVTVLVHLAWLMKTFFSISVYLPILGSYCVF